MVLLQGEAGEEYGQLRKEESLWRLYQHPGEHFGSISKGTNKQNQLLVTAPAALCLCVTLGTAWAASTMKGQLCFMPMVSGASPAPISHSIYPTAARTITLLLEGTGKVSTKQRQDSKLQHRIRDQNGTPCPASFRLE